jgi:glycine/D-amino acid oxidase-like deaminating enzyme
MSGNATFAPGFVEQPWWWDDAPPEPTAMTPLPDTADALIVGGGIAGLSTAIELGRAGVKALVIDRETIGWGASSRNGGALSGAGALGRAKTNLHQAVEAKLLAEMVDEAEASFEDFEALLAREGIDCAYRRCGRFVGAHAPKAMDALKRRADMLNRSGRDTAEILDRARVGEELATERYHGGLVIRRAGGLHPGRYVHGLAAAARRHGATLASGVELREWSRTDGLFRVRTSGGEIAARALMIATNGYTGRATPWHRRRVIPIASYMIATEELGEARVRRLLPKLRVYGDTKKILYYFRPAPDFSRILFGGRASFRDEAARHGGARLHRCLIDLIPDLAGTRITHAWKGSLAFAFDMLPHVGVHDGVHFALGCNGSGVVPMTHLGRCAARMILGGGNTASAFARLPLPGMPFYTGTPWFMPVVGNWYRLRDWLDGWRVGG